MRLEHVVHCAPLGQSNWQDFVLRKIGSTPKQIISETVIVLPSPYLLEQARRLLREVDFESWQPPLVRSMDQLAEQVAGSKIFGRKMLSRVSQEIMLDGLIRKAIHDGLLKWSVSIATEPGFVKALAGLFDEFKMSGAGPEEVSVAFEAIEENKEESIPKYRELELLFRLYQKELHDKRFLDIGEVYLLALEALNDDTVQLPFSRLILAEFSVLSPLRAELLKQLKRYVSIELLFQYEKNRPAVFSAVAGTYSDLVGMGFETRTIIGKNEKSPYLAHVCQNLYSNTPSFDSSGGCMKIASFASSRKEMEVLADEVKRRLLEKDCRPDEVAVIARTRDYLQNMTPCFAARGIPIDADEAIPLAATSVALLLDRFIKAARGGGDKDSVVPLLKSLYVKRRLAIDPDKIEENCLDRVIRSWEDWTTGGGDEYEGIVQLQIWADRWQAAAEFGEKAQILIDFLYWVDIPLQLGCERKNNFGRLSADVFQAEIHALKKMHEILYDLIESASFYHSNIRGEGGQDFVLIFQLAMQGEMIALKRRDAGGVQVVTPETASGMLFDSVFLVGMSEGIFPRMQYESWLLSEEERGWFEEAGIFLTRSGNRQKNEDLAFALGMGMAKSRLNISGVKNEDLLFSSYVSDLLAIFPAEEVVSKHHSGKEYWPEDESEIFDGRSLGCLLVRKIWQERTNELRWKDLYSSLKSNMEIFPDGWNEKAKLEYLKPPEFRGQLQFNQENGDLPHSVTALEIYANCPFVYLTDEVLHLRQWEHAEVGMNERIKGLIWHEVLAGFLGQYRGKRLNPRNSTDYLKELTTLLDISVARFVSAKKLVLDVWWKSEAIVWQDGLKRWLELEIERQSLEQSVPAYFEWSFGRAPASSSDPYSVAEALALSSAEQTVQLQGKVDRVDLLSDGNFRVIDYKTGKVPSAGQFTKGTVLQVPVYMLAVDRFLGVRNKSESEGEYLSLAYSGRRMKIPGRNNREEIIKEVTISVLDYAERIRKGDFSPDPTGSCPAYCLNRDCCHFVKQIQTPVEDDFDE